MCDFSFFEKWVMHRAASVDLHDAGSVTMSGLHYVGDLQPGWRKRDISH